MTPGSYKRIESGNYWVQRLSVSVMALGLLPPKTTAAGKGARCSGSDNILHHHSVHRRPPVRATLLDQHHAASLNCQFSPSSGCGGCLKYAHHGQPFLIARRMKASQSPSVFSTSVLVHVSRTSRVATWIHRSRVQMVTHRTMMSCTKKEMQDNRLLHQYHGTI